MSLGSKRPTFKPTPYGYTRRRRGIPRWLWLLITGVVLGVGGVLFLQSSYGPQRLTVEQSEQLRIDLNTTKLENQRLMAASKKATEATAAAEKDQQEQARATAAMRQQLLDMQAGVASLIDAIAPDPRGSNPGIRAGNMVLHPDGLHYSVLLIQEPADGATPTDGTSPTFKGAIKLVATGTYSNGQTGYIELADQPLTMGLYTTVSGQSELPKGFRVRLVTVQITPAGSDKVVSTRTLKVAVAR